LKTSVTPSLALALCCLVLIASLHSSAQQAASPQETPFSLQVNVNRVLVPVVVRDHNGAPVGDLQKEDFQVFDNDKLRAVSAFTVEKRGAPSVPAAGSQQPAAQPDAATTAPPLPAPQRFIVFLFDDMHLNPDEMALARKAGAKVLSAALTDSDIAAVVSLSGKTNSGLTRDRSKLQDAIIGLQSRSLYKSDKADCPSIDYYQADLIENKRDSGATDDAVRKVLNCNPGIDPKYQIDAAQNLAESAARRALTMGRLDVLSSYATIEEIVKRMGALPGERTLILASPGFLNIEQEALTAESRIMDLAAQSNVTISTLDARGLYTTELTAGDRSPSLSGPGLIQNAEYRRSTMRQGEDVMAELADGTGGTYFHNSNDLEAGFRRLAQSPEVVYLLELSLDNIRQDGSLHRLKVKVDRPGVELESRHSYFVPKPEKTKK
jgi:VWFA-related protein